VRASSTRDPIRLGRKPGIVRTSQRPLTDVRQVTNDGPRSWPAHTLPLALPVPGTGSHRPARRLCPRRWGSAAPRGVLGHASGRVCQGIQTTQPLSRPAPDEERPSSPRTGPARPGDCPSVSSDGESLRSLRRAPKRPRGTPE